MDHLVMRRTEPLNAIAKSADTVTFSLRRSTVTIKRLDAGVHAALLALDTESTLMADTVRTARELLPEADITRLVRELGRLYVRGAFLLAVEDGGEPVCELSSNSILASFGFDLDDAWDQRYRLSRFAVIRRGESGLLVESLAASARLSIHRSEVGAVLAALHEPVDEAEIVGRVPALPVSVLGACLRVMKAGGVIGRVDQKGLLPEDHEPDLAVREPQDVYLHTRSRPGLSPDAVGGTFRHATVMPPFPAIHPALNGRRIALPRPDLDRLMRTDPPFTVVMERRRSQREWADRPLTLAELGEFLYRVFRVREFQPRDPSNPRSYEATRRPIPSGGGAHDLEVYIAAGRIQELGKELHHYDPVEHAVTEIAGSGHAVSAILRAAQGASLCAAEPPAVVVLASRFGRLAWKYEGIAYSATLKNVGVAYTAMYLAATAMGLAACGLGAGDSEAFGLATGHKPYVESPVGEFMIGPART